MCNAFKAIKRVQKHRILHLVGTRERVKKTPTGEVIVYIYMVIYHNVSTLNIYQTCRRRFSDDLNINKLCYARRALQKNILQFTGRVGLLRDTPSELLPNTVF